MVLRKWQKEFIRHVYDPVTDDGLRRIRRALLSVARKNGKGLALGTPIPTPSGWTTMGAVQVGDLVYDEMGDECRVTAVSEHRRLDCYEVTFSNGERIVCDGDHLWRTHSHVQRRTDVRDTRELFATQFYGARLDRNHRVAVARPLCGRQSDLLVDPYVLGAWLGDGASASARLTVGAADCAAMQSQLTACGLAIDVRIEKGKSARTFQMRTPGATKNSENNLQKRLRAIGVLGKKHIPRNYLRASESQRIALLQGLMDTDGTVSKNGRVLEYATTNDFLAIGMCELLASLGIKYSCTPKQQRCNGVDLASWSYRIQFMAFRDELAAFRLPRKLERMRDSRETAKAARSKTIQIVRIVPVETVTTKCIAVDSPSRMFLCGRSMIPTHNSALAAALVLVHLVGPESRTNGEVYSAATDRHQAGHIYKMARQMIELDPELSLMCKCMDSIKRIVCYHNGSFYVSLSADARRQHGFNPSFVIYDELAQALNREMYDVLSTSFGAQKEGLLLVISTQSSDPLSIMSELSDDAIKQEAGYLDDPHFYGKVYYVPDEIDKKKVDIYNPAVWHLANPALNDFRDLTDFQALAAKAQRSPSAEASFRNLYLNQRVDGLEVLIRAADWRACEGTVDPRDLVGRPCYGGLDLSSRRDLTALALAWPLADGRIALKLKFFAPREGVEEREKTDGAHYRVWSDQGFLHLTDGPVVDYSVVADEISAVMNAHDFQGLAYDRWRINDLKSELLKLGISADEKNDSSAALRLLPYGQGFKDIAPAIDAFENAALEHKLRHGGNPVLTWCVSNVKVVRDPAGNRKFDKSKTNKRIDGAVAAAMALAAINRIEIVPPKGPSVYETRGVLAL